MKRIIKTQPSQISIWDASELTNEGINRAVEHADDENLGWSQRAFLFLLRYMCDKRTFMTEEVREAAKHLIPDPPSQRAWGGIVRRAVTGGFVKKIGFKPVSNPKAHQTPASVWQVLK
jgi:hypothetical protein